MLRQWRSFRTLAFVLGVMAAPGAQAADVQGDLWAAAETGNTVEAYTDYLARFPKGRFAAQAKQRKAKLIELADAKAWRDAEQVGDIAAYEKYLVAYPAGKSAAPARGKLKLLRDTVAASEEKAVWEAAEASRDRATIQDYLKRYKSARFATQAKARLAALDRYDVMWKPGNRVKVCDICPELVTIPGGRFEMGNAQQESEQPVHSVAISTFAMGRAEVTQAQWVAVMGENPSRFVGCDDCPVERMSFDDVQDYLRELGKRTGVSFRLPSEAEWEYACRAGGQNAYCGSDDLSVIAWYDQNSAKKTHPVALKKPNGFGLHDMTGNVWEWVSDCMNPDFKGAPVDGSAWMAGDCKRRVQRGGAISSGANLLRPTYRTWDRTSLKVDYFYGFRVAVSQGPAY